MTKVKTLKEEAPMNANSPSLPLPQTEKKRLMQAEVNLELFNAVHKEMERRGLKIRNLMEWGLKAFLLQSNPREAARLGISNEQT